MKRLLLTFIGFIVLKAPAFSMDPFTTEDQARRFVTDYKNRKPLLPKRATHGMPLGLRMEMIRLPKFKLKDASLAEAVLTLEKAIREQDPKNKDVRFLLGAFEASYPVKITLDLDDVTGLKALNFITDVGGTQYSVLGQQFIMGRNEGSFGSWRGAEIRNFFLTEALAKKWFPKAKLADQGDKGPIWRAEADLDKMGIAFNPDATADFVPSLNCLSIIHCSHALFFIQTLIDEAESEQTILSSLKMPEAIPKGMVLHTFHLHDADMNQMRLIMKRKDGLLHPECCTTEDALKREGGTFPPGSKAWFDAKTRSLYVINTQVHIEEIKEVMALN